MRVGVAFLVATAMCSTAVLGQDKGIDLSGMGNVGCDEAVSWIERDDFIGEDARLSYAQWVWGYWSGLNVAALNRGEQSRDLSIFQSGSDVAYAIATECNNRLEDRVFQSADAVYERLKLK